MIISWLITTLATSVLIVLVEYIYQLSISNDNSGIYIAPSFLELILAVIAINLFFWLPAIAYLHKSNKVSLISSVISSITASVIGTACVIGIGVLFFYTGVQPQQTDDLSKYTDWTIGHIHYLPGLISNVVLWGISGIIFWKLYGKFSTNKLFK